MCRCGECFGCSAEQPSQGFRIFDAADYLDMALASHRFGSLALSQGTLNNVAIKIATLDDPYYSRLNGRTYMAARRLASPSEITELARQHDYAEYRDVLGPRGV